MIFSRQTAFFNLYSHSLDLKLSEAERMRTILQTLQQIESKIDFNEQSHPTQEHEVKKKRGRPSKAPQK